MQTLELGEIWVISRIFLISARLRMRRAGLGAPGGAPRAFTAVAPGNHPPCPQLSTGIHKKKKKQCAGTNRQGERMKESCGEGLAIHTGPESCVVDRKVGREALIRVRAGQVLSRESFLLGADAIASSGRLHPEHRYREMRWSLARSKTLCMHGNTLCGNREVPSSPVTDTVAGRNGKSKDLRRR